LGEIQAKYEELLARYTALERTVEEGKFVDDVAAVAENVLPYVIVLVDAQTHKVLLHTHFWRAFVDQGIQFLKRFISSEYEGGREAAVILKDAVAWYVESIYSEDSGYRIVIHVYGSFETLSADVNPSVTTPMPQTRTFKLFAGGFAGAELFFEFIDVLNRRALESKISSMCLSYLTLDDGTLNKSRAC
jgi:hypothetical protein